MAIGRRSASNVIASWVSRFMFIVTSRETKHRLTRAPSRGFHNVPEEIFKDSIPGIILLRHILDERQVERRNDLGLF